MRHILVTILLVALSRSFGWAQIQAYRTLDQKDIHVTANSSYSSSASPQNLINGSGLSGLLHDNEMSAYTMWHTGFNPPISQADPATQAGPAWVRFELARITDLKEMLVWNHNQAEYSSRGLKKVYIEYSQDGRTWKVHRNGKQDTWTIARAAEKNGESISQRIDLTGVKAKYLCLTAAHEDGNYGDNIFGLSEVIFVTNEPVEVSLEATMIPTDKVYQGNPANREVDFGFTDAIGFGTDTLAYSYGPYLGAAVVNPGGGPIRMFPLLLPYDEGAIHQSYHIRLKNTPYQQTIVTEPVRHWTIHLIAQSHVDIGYTDYADKVSGVYNKNFAYAIDLARKTRDYPKGSGFRWNAEVLWPVDVYLGQATSEQARNFREAVKNGWINLDAAYGSINTSLCNGEQLLRLFEYGDSLEKLLDVNLIATQQVDVPGASWGIVEAMSQSGVKFFLNLPNYMDDNYLENRPFFWESPSGKSRILHFQTYYYNLGYHLKGRYIPNYLQGNTDPVYQENPDDYFLDPFIFSFLDQLKGQGYAYRQLPLAWTMTDNAALDPDLPEVVRRWNQNYLNPKVLISSAADFYHDFIAENESIVPVLAGDYTESWTDGVASGSIRVNGDPCQPKESGRYPPP